MKFAFIAAKTGAFPVAWMILYALMAYALWRILALPESRPGRPVAIIAFFVQLALNGLWSFAFFGARPKKREPFRIWRSGLSLWIESPERWRPCHGILRSKRPPALGSRPKRRRASEA